MRVFRGSGERSGGFSDLLGISMYSVSRQTDEDSTRSSTPTRTGMLTIWHFLPKPIFYHLRRRDCDDAVLDVDLQHFHQLFGHKRLGTARTCSRMRRKMCESSNTANCSSSPSLGRRSEGIASFHGHDEATQRRDRLSPWSRRSSATCGEVVSTRGCGRDPPSSSSFTSVSIHRQTFLGP